MESTESWFHRRATLYVETQILFHLNQVGVWSLLKSSGGQTAHEIAEVLRLDRAATETLLDYVLGVDDLLERDPQGRYSLSEFGVRVIERFSDIKADAGRPSINMFDVRVGAYGPVWQNLGRMLSGAGRYGEDFNREGRYAENGVFKLAMRFWDSLVAHVEESGAHAILEIGLTTGLLERLAETYPSRLFYGLDKSRATIEKSAAAASQKDIGNIRWIESDYYDPDRWTRAIEAGQTGLIYSLHFHELMAAGEDEFVAVLRRLKSLLPSWVLVAFEQPRLPPSARASTPEAQWLYSQSNILIHHLIGNGRILGSDAWKELGHRAGCRQVTERACNYLGYKAFAFQL
jgi:hypothetical protein